MADPQLHDLTGLGLLVVLDIPFYQNQMPSSCFMAKPSKTQFWR